MPDLPPIRTGNRNRLYNWARHAAKLRARPGEWVMLEPTIAITRITELRAGRQPHLASLAPHVEYAMRATTPNPTGGARVGELWARYNPDVTIKPKRPRVTPDLARIIREQYADGDVSTNELARIHGISQAYVSMILHGQRFADAPGPILTTTSTSKGQR